ncbi:MAG TPA: hypothetical protein VMU94_18670 [Streptosporangiaceae bacterium]|nr:hypothetical protein [Streptosporangiaceae bacterium]
MRSRRTGCLPLPAELPCCAGNRHPTGRERASRRVGQSAHLIGYSADVVAGVSMISKFSDFIAIIVSGLCALPVGAAGLASRRLPRWAGWISVVAGVVGLAAGTGSGQLKAGTLVWLAWLVMIGVVLMRGPARRAPSTPGADAAGQPDCRRIAVN